MERNRFQKWADDYARAFGFIVTPYANWVLLQRSGEAPIECMSAAGVQTACEAVNKRSESQP